MFQALSVFRGGFTPQAAEQVTGASLPELTALVDKSLLQRASTGRYEWHELLRQYAAEKLEASGRANTVRDAHCLYYAAALQEWGEDLKGAWQQTALAEIEADSENARRAWNWAVEQGRVEQLDQAMDGLCRFCERRGRYRDGEALCRTAANRLASAEKLATTPSSDRQRLLARVLTWQGVFSEILGRTGRAGQLLQQGLALLEELELDDQDTRSEKAHILLQMGHTVTDSDREEARRLYEQSLMLYRALGDRWGVANALSALGLAVRRLGTYGEAKQLYEESLALRRALGDQKGIADSLHLLGNLATYRGPFEESARLLQESIAIYQEMGDRGGVAHGYLDLAAALCLLGKFAETLSLLEESVAACNDLGFRYGSAYSTCLLSHVELHLGRYEQARAQGRLGIALARESDFQWGVGFCLFGLGCVALAMEEYAEAQQLLQESVAVFRAIVQRDELGWALALLGIATHRLGQLSQAEQYLYEALQTAAEIGAIIPLMYALPAIAILLADQGKDERAVELYGLASRYPYVADSRWFEDTVGRQIEAIVAGVPTDLVAAIRARGRERDLNATVDELLAELI